MVSVYSMWWMEELTEFVDLRHEEYYWRILYIFLDTFYKYEMIHIYVLKGIASLYGHKGFKYEEQFFLA